MTDTVLAVAGSARRNGNSDTLLKKALEPFKDAGHEVQWVIPQQFQFAPCRSCHGCWETGRCVIDDQMQGLYTDFCEAEHIIVAAPTYFTSLPGRLKMLIDRFQCFWVRTYRLGEPPTPRRTAMFMSVAAMEPEKYFTCCSRTIRTWLSTLNAETAIQKHYTGLDSKDDIDERQDYLDDARRAGQELLQSEPSDE